MNVIPWWPVVWVDVIGSVLSLLIGVWCVGRSWFWARKKFQDPFRHYLFLLTIAIGTFTISRSFGHIVKQFLLMAGRRETWSAISPFSGAVNTATFITIFAFGIYFDRIRQIKLRADRDAVALATARTRADAALEAEIRMRTIFDGIEDAIYLVDDDYRVLLFNRKMHDLLPGIAIGASCHQLLFGRAEPCADCRFRDLPAGQSFSMEVELPIIGRAVNINGIRLRWISGKTVNLAVLRDISEQKRLEAQLLQSQKLEAVGTLAGGIAHDFNNLLTAIIGYSDILRVKLGRENPLLADVGEIRRAAGRAAGLVRQLLAFSRKQKAALEVVDLNGIIRNMEMMLDRLIGEDIEMVMELAEGLLPVRVDSGQIEQVAVNLVVNGRDAMPLGGRIIVRTEVVELGEGVLPPQTQAHAGLFACLTVTDSGRGMSKEVIDKAFEPFFTTKEVGKGSGLGLAVAYGIVEQHGGWIRIDSELGKGTSFRVYLPLHARDEVTAPVKDDAGKQPPQGHQERILLVEDQEEVLQVALSMLEGNGYQVLAAATMAEAVMLFEQQGESIDLLFSDIVLPDGNGLLLEERFRARKPGLPVLMSSGYVDDRMQLALLQERRLPFLQKPYTMEALLAAVRQVLAAANGHLS